MASNPRSRLPRVVAQKLKERRKQEALGTVVWEHRRFTNPARTDGLQLGHWIKCLKDSAGEVRLADPGPYHFAKYNKKARLRLAVPLTGAPSSQCLWSLQP